METFWAGLTAAMATGRHFCVRYKKQLKILLMVAIPLLVAGTVVPALVATQTIRRNVITVPLAFLLYSYLWVNSVVSGFRCLRGLYGHPIKSIFSGIETEEEYRREFTARVINSLVFSFGFTVYGFAVTYVFLSNVRPESFNAGKLGMFTGIYFSLTTIATVGFGDIVPVTTFARLVVMFEILAGMLYAIFAFSILATFLREKRPPNRN